MSERLERIRKTKREYMARKRAADPVAARRYQMEAYQKNRDARTEKMRHYYAKRFFWGRAMKLRGQGRATPAQLSKLWKRQRGRCALTGRKLKRAAQLDHIIPKARGGSDGIENLRWVCEEVNILKRHLMDSEFFQLCQDVLNHRG